VSKEVTLEPRQMIPEEVPWQSVNRETYGNLRHVRHDYTDHISDLLYSLSMLFQACPQSEAAIKLPA